MNAGPSYGALGLPLAFVALPLYVLLPNHYATRYGVPLAALGAVLLGARALDALTDPFIGRLVDGWFAGSRTRLLGVAWIASVALVLGSAGLFFPPAGVPLLPWCLATLTVTYLAYSVLGVLHQSWGARLGGDERARARIVAWREGLALAGVLLASVLPSLAGLEAAGVVFVGTLAAALALLARAPWPPARPAPASSLALPLATPAFRRLLGVNLANGIAAAVPATLVLFYVRDHLQAPGREALFLGAYFAAGALSMPLWVRGVGRFGLARSWLAGMVLAIASFGWAAGLGPGDAAAFVAVCVASGCALGADLALPGALLAGVIREAGHAGRLEGGYFGWWNLATKLNLALAAGLALPLLGAFGYTPGERDAGAQRALAVVYGGLPCLLKGAAAALLYRHWIRIRPGP